MTPGEGGEGLRGAAVTEDDVEAFDVCASRCDLVKFARLRPASDACRDILEAARAFVAQTQPRADVVEGPDSTGQAGEWDAPELALAHTPPHDEVG